VSFEHVLLPYVALKTYWVGCSADHILTATLLITSYLPSYPKIQRQDASGRRQASPAATFNKLVERATWNTKFCWFFGMGGALVSAGRTARPPVVLTPAIRRSAVLVFPPQRL
jgi:hypothetical protein